MVQLLILLNMIARREVIKTLGGQGYGEDPHGQEVSWAIYGLFSYIHTLNQSYLDIAKE